MTLDDGTVTGSVDEPTCAVDGCDQSVVPGQAECGLHLIEGAPQTDGTVSPQATLIAGYSDGTGRSGTRHHQEDIAVNTEDIVESVSRVDDGDESAAPLRRALIALAEQADARELIPESWAEDGTVAAAEAEPESEPELDPVEDPEPETEPEIEPEPTPEPEEKSSKRRWKPRHRSTPAPVREIRLRTADVQMRAASSQGDLTLTGRPIVYNSSYSVFDMFGEFKETMAPTVCDHVLSSPLQLDCRYLFNHQGMPLARTQSGTLELTNSAQGLDSVAHMDPRQTLANDLAVAVERGDVSQMSCGFIVASDAWNDDMTERTIYSFEELLDVSPVTYPASPTTSVSLATRAMFGMPEESRARLREAFRLTNEVRAGKVLSANNASAITSALQALYDADDLDLEDVANRAMQAAQAHQAARQSLEQVTGLDPADDTDGDAVTENDPGDGIRSDEADTETRDEDAVAQASELRRKAAIARRDRLARKRYLA